MIRNAILVAIVALIVIAVFSWQSREDPTQPIVIKAGLRERIKERLKRLFQ